MPLKKYAYPLGLILAANLAGCTGQSAENAEIDKRIAICQDVMKLYIKEANTHERDRKRLIGTCHMSQKERTTEQWQCTLAGMQGGGKYAEVSDKCTGGLRR
ncbi:hypothetical protein [Methylogaea oryzae]|uniref:Uncharacterized protein n=1 Tax=Methylogaea oryzae TaxID=1295382 RepID=A0A8D5AGX6_9GAMM|nr:hypothetical protein [Methylogaea oryzae]BBL70858.1 hypothetical protein MoryE10_14640 [Methylogaea oryzae]